MCFHTESVTDSFRTSPVVLLLFFYIMSCSCLHDPQGISPQPELDLSGFAMVWDSYELNYPLFQLKGIDWMEICGEYYPQAVGCETQEDLRVIITQMLGELEDPSLILLSFDLQDTIRTYERECYTNVDPEVLMENYLEPNGYQGYVQGFGWCDPQILPYAFFDTLPTFESELAVAALDTFVSRCIQLQVPGIILDVRMNPSGTRADFHSFDRTAMSRFTSKPIVCAWYRVRVGPVYDQYHDFHPWIVPQGAAQYSGTVYLLAGGGCTQAAEDFVLNMEHFSNVVVVGDTTAGIVTETGALIPLGMEGGWMASSAVSTILTYEKEWVENAGFPPDLFVDATPEDFSSGVDPVLEHAMELLLQYR